MIAVPPDPRFAGLSADAVARARAEHGPNELPEPRRSRLRALARQFHSVLVYILLGALALSIAMPFVEGGELSVEAFLDAIVIATIIVLNAVLGYVQESRAEQAIAALRSLSAPTARVRRDGVVQEIPSSDVVPGDRLLVEAGARVAADATLVRADSLCADESALTGEALEATKDVEPAPPEAPLAEQRHRLFAGTYITQGTAEADVTATGTATEVGRIAAAVSGTAIPATPLSKRIERLSRMIGAVVGVLCVGVVGVGLARDLPLTEVLLVGVSLAVSAVPEGLPAVVTVCFALGVRAIARRQAIVRRLDSLETLGCVTVVCADKTGTITENRMTVVRTVLVGERAGDSRLLLDLAASCTRAELPRSGDPTELALLAHAAAHGGTAFPIDVEEVAFSATTRRMQTRHTVEGASRVFLKGAPETVDELCGGDGELLARAEELAADGLRVLAAATDDGDRLRPLGLFGIEDPAREGVLEAVEAARAAGIRTVMITGDNPITASTIAARVGIEGAVALGTDLPVLMEDRARLARVGVFARVEPLHKLEILRALQEDGEIVAMSGDGVNDAPALKGAHVGVAMGKRGTETARAAASIVLLDDHFATIVRAIEEGRRIHDNIRRFVLFLLRANFDELILILAALALKLPLPYLPVHILWINLMTDGLPALALGTEPAEPDVMRRPPRAPGESLLAGTWGRLVGSALVGVALTLGWYLHELASGVPLDQARASTLTLAIGFELVLAYSSRSRLPAWRLDPRGNPWLLRATAVVVAMHAGLLYSPLADAFHLAAPPLRDLVSVAALVVLGAVTVEVGKAVAAKRTVSGGTPP